MKELRESIRKALGTVTPKNAPRVYEMIQSEQGYKNIEEMIIRLMVGEDLTASGCIPHIEDQL